jgi:ABC-type antimicrobial peptide transport system permease subunit
VATAGDALQLLVVVSVIAVLASLVAIRRAIRVDPRGVLGLE